MDLSVNLNIRHFLLGAGSTFLQIAVSSISLLVLYKLLIGIVGVAHLGVWSLILAASSFVHLANSGLTGGVVTHIADLEAKGLRASTVRSIQTAALSMGVFGLVLVIVCYPIARQYLSFTLTEENRAIAMEILPLGLAAFWIYTITGVYQAGLYGCQLIVRRNGLLMIESLTHLILCVTLATRFGLLGLVYARVIQNMLTLGFTIFALRRHLLEMPIIPLVWDRTLFRLQAREAGNFQLVSLLTILADPLTKGLLSSFGSVTWVGYYEMANKLVQQLRSIIVGVNQMLVPMFAQLKALDPQKVQHVYQRSYELTCYFAFPSFTLLGISAPLICTIWIGHYEPIFVAAVAILSVGWLFSTLSAPAYFALMGTGHMHVNLHAHIAMTVMNVSFALVLGTTMGGIGVIMAWTLTLCMTALLVNILYAKKSRRAIKLTEFLPKTSHGLVLACFMSAIGSCLIYFTQIGISVLDFHPSSGTAQLPFMLIGMIAAAISIGLISVPFWKHPARSQLNVWLAQMGSKRTG